MIFNRQDNVDYHIHTYYSDGRLSPAEAVTRYKNICKDYDCKAKVFIKMPADFDDDDIYESKVKTKSDLTVVPQYMIGLDVSLPIIPVAGGVEYRYIDSKFKGFNDTEENFNAKSKIHTFLMKARIKF